jgi:ketosteroid isomerase-like protein
MVRALASRRVVTAFLAVTLAACSTRTVQQASEVTATAVGSGTDDVQDLVRLALTLDAAADRKADTLYASDAVVVGNARIRLAAPRFAGVGGAGSGRVTITAANATVSGGLAWVLVDYRWISSAEQRADVGRATVICERRGSGWKIVHAHSSQPLPWEP